LVSSDLSLTPIPKADREEGTPELDGLFERFSAEAVSPSEQCGCVVRASRKTIYTFGQRAVSESGGANGCQVDVHPVMDGVRFN
jgi:hypothetical protein